MADQARKPEPGDSLAKSPDLQTAYAQGLAAKQPLQQPKDLQPAREPITAAQDTNPIKAMSIRSEQLKAAQPAQDLYKQRAAAIVAEIRSEQGLDGSQMVKQQQPTPKPKNTTPEAKAQDAKTFNANWSAEQARAQAYQDRAAKAAAEEKAAQEQASEQSQEIGRGR